MDSVLQSKFNDAIWVAHNLFGRCKTSGSSGNISFLHKGNIFITSGGSCFGTLTQDDFACVTFDNTVLNGKKASKEFTLHKHYYGKSSSIQSIIHTHGPFAVLWSCREFERETDILPTYTPYFEMKVGKIGLIPYQKPGSQELFDAFKNNLQNGDAYLLKNHGGIVGGKTILDAFYNIEELEESARLACLIEPYGIFSSIKAP